MRRGCRDLGNAVNPTDLFNAEIRKLIDADAACMHPDYRRLVQRKATVAEQEEELRRVRKMLERASNPSSIDPTYYPDGSTRHYTGD